MDISFSMYGKDANSHRINSTLSPHKYPWLQVVRKLSGVMNSHVRSLSYMNLYEKLTFGDLVIDFFMPIFKWFVGSVVIDEDSVPISEAFDFAIFEVECCSPIPEGS